MAWINNKKVNDIIPQSWIIDCLKIYKNSDEIIRFIKKTLNNRKVKLKARGKSLAEVKIMRGIFQGDALSLLLFVIAMMSLNHKLRKCTDVYKPFKCQEKINHLIYMDDINSLPKMKKNCKP